MNSILNDIDDLDRMVDTDAAKDAIRSQIRLIDREISAMEAEYSRLAEQHATLLAAQPPPAESSAETFTHVRGLFYAADDPIPFCSRCWEAAGRRIHLFGPIPMFHPEIERWECHTCNAGYSAKPNENFLMTGNRRRREALTG